MMTTEHEMANLLKICLIHVMFSEKRDFIYQY